MLARYTFREAQRADIPYMKLIRDNVTENTLVTIQINAPDYEKAMFEDGKAWVCLNDSAVIGFSCGRLKQRDVWALFIDQRYEGQGIGHQLMQLLEDWMFASGCQEIVLTTGVGRHGSVAEQGDKVPASIKGDASLAHLQWRSRPLAH